MQAPEDVLIALRNVRSTFDLILNPMGKLVGGSSYDANGNPREKQYEPRWELWDTDAHGQRYLVMKLEGQGRSFMPPGMWLPELIRQIDPARYGGDVHKMAEAWIDKPNDHIAALDEDAIKDLADNLASMYYDKMVPKFAVSRSIQ